MGEITVTNANPVDMEEVGRNLLPAVAETYAAGTRTVSGLPSVLAGPAGWECRAFADAVQGILAETGDSMYDAGVALCKMAVGYETTDQVNADLLPKEPDFDLPEPLNPKLRTI